MYCARSIGVTSRPIAEMSCLRSWFSVVTSDTVVYLEMVVYCRTNVVQALSVCFSHLRHVHGKYSNFGFEGRQQLHFLRGRGGEELGC